MPIPQLSKKSRPQQTWRNASEWHFSGAGRHAPLSSFRMGASRGRRRYSRQFITNAVYAGLIGCMALALFGFAYTLMISRDLPDPNRLIDRDIAESTKIYDRTGETILYDIHGVEQRTIVNISELPDYVKWATITAEDRTFYEHHGFNLWGILRGVLLDPFRKGYATGGSTLTQQLVKNAILTDERSVARKIKEFILSYRIENKFSKDEILQMYFNEIPYGSTAYGVEAAARRYFNLSAKDLNLAQAAILAALPQRPSYLSPYGNHLDELYGRQQYALSQMVKLGYITEAEAEAAKLEEVEFKNRIKGVIAPHFVFYVKELLSDKYGEKMIEQGGLKVISTLDYELQKKAEEIITEYAEKNLDKYNASNVALVSIDINTGQILAMVGSKDFFDEKIDGQVNVVLASRQPGSSFKPIVYTAAWQRGYVPETTIYDLETVFPVITEDDYIPHNYDLTEHGPVTLRKALAGSLNIPAVKMIYLTGIDNVLNLADSLGYSTLKDRRRFGLSLVLGGGEINLLEHTNAFAVFARDGKYLPTTAVLKLEEPDGRLMEEFNEARAQKIIEPDIARITNNVLSDNQARAYVFGESNYLTLSDRPVAAKTGTTNDYRDAWTIGYTPQVATGVWVGNNDNSEMNRGADGGVVAAPIWQKYMKEAVASYPVKDFIKPSYSIPNKPMLGGESSGVKVKIDKMSGLLATEATPEHLVEEKTFKQAHSILYYVNKDDPLGAQPKDPNNDEYYKYWEEAVEKWAKKEGIINENPPTEFDNIHKLSDKPQVNLISPTNNETLSSERVSLEAQANAPRGINKIEFYLDNKLINTIYQPPYIYNYSIPYTYLNGPHLFTVKAYDDLENVSQSQATITLTRQAYINISWLEPATSTTLTQADFPYNLIIHIEEIERVDKIDFYFRLADSNNSQWLGYINDVFDNSNQVTWSTAPAPGTYKVYPVITDYLNSVVSGPEITISIE